MYIFELIAEKIKEKRSKTDYTYVSPVLQNDYEKCNHTFQPIDSTGEILACTKCGKLTKNNVLMYKKKNPFS